MPSQSSEEKKHETIESPYRISWIRVGKYIIPLLVLVFALAYWFVYVFIPSQIEQPNQTPVAPKAKVSTDSAKLSTQSAQKDQTAGWKTYTSKLGVFEVKYPNNITPKVTSNKATENLILTKKEFGNTKLQENIQITVNGTSGFCEGGPDLVCTQKKVTLSGKEAFRYDKVKSEDQIYQILNLKSGNYVLISLNGREGNEELFDQIISTLRFLD